MAPVSILTMSDKKQKIPLMVHEGVKWGVFRRRPSHQKSTGRICDQPEAWVGVAKIGIGL